MATMTLKNLPDALYLRLKESAAQHRRSLNSEAIVCLERALGLRAIDPARFLAEVRDQKTKLAQVYVTQEDLEAAMAEGRP